MVAQRPFDQLMHVFHGLRAKCFGLPTSHDERTHGGNAKQDDQRHHERSEAHCVLGHFPALLQRWSLSDDPRRPKQQPDAEDEQNRREDL